MDYLNGDYLNGSDDDACYIVDQLSFHDSEANSSKRRLIEGIKTVGRR